MNKRHIDDPKTVLEFVNSLGIVGVTASELKELIKELKVYWKTKDTKRKQLSKDNIINIESENRNSQILQNIVYIKNQELSHAASIHESEGSICKQNNAANIYGCQTIKSKKQLQKTFENKSCTNYDVLKDTYSNKQDEKKRFVPLRKTNSIPSNRTKNVAFDKPCYKSKSITNPSSISKISTELSASKKVANDPVTLYNKYKNIWAKTPFPGENSHPQLRWTIRTKMLERQ